MSVTNFNQVAKNLRKAARDIESLKGEKIYAKALRYAAEEAYIREIVETQMEDLTIGKGMDYADREDWIQSRMDEWIAEVK